MEKFECMENMESMETSLIVESIETNSNVGNGTQLFDYVNDFFTNNKNEYEKIKTIMKMIIAKLSNDALNHNTFCDLFATPNNFPEVLFKILNISGKQVAEAFYEIGFFKGNPMHADNYYHSLLLMYYIGLLKNDQLLRLYSLSLIHVKLYNGRKTRYFPKGCIPEIASYIVANMLRSSHTFKRFKTPFHIVVEYWAPNLDQTYADRIRATPFDHREGLIKILAQAWARVDQTFMGIQEHYYNAHAQGLKDVSMKVTDSGSDMHEQVNQHDAVFDKLAEKINRTLLIKKYKLDAGNIQAINKAMILPAHYLEKSEEYLNSFIDDGDSDSDGDGLKPIYESILRAFNLFDEPSICNIHISSYVNKIGGNQTDKNIASFKQMIDRICINIFKDIFSAQTYNQQQKIRKLVTTLIIFRLKAAVCSNTQYDGI